MANQLSHSFPTTTTLMQKKTCVVKNNKNKKQSVETLFSTEGKSAHLFIGSMSTQGNDTQCQRCSMEVAHTCEE